MDPVMVQVIASASANFAGRSAGAPVRQVGLNPIGDHKRKEVGE